MASYNYVTWHHSALPDVTSDVTWHNKRGHQTSQVPSPGSTSGVIWRHNWHYLTSNVTLNDVTGDAIWLYVWGRMSFHVTSQSSHTYRVTSLFASFCAMPRRHVTSHDFRSGIDTRKLTLDMLTSRHVTHGLASHVMSMICEVWNVHSYCLPRVENCFTKL